MLAELYVLSGRDAGKVVNMALGGPTIFMGRAATNQLRIRDPQASRVHCRIDVSTEGFTLQDANSGNGTFVNGERVEDTLSLTDGDEIVVGATRMMVLIETEADRELWGDSGSASGKSGDSTLEQSNLEISTFNPTPLDSSDLDEDTVRPGSSEALKAAAMAAGEASSRSRDRKRKKALREVIPGYHLDARLGGASSRRSGIAVYRATQRSLERSVALKVFLRRGNTESREVERFLREAKAIARLPHPNIVTIHDVISRGKIRAIVMEYLRGGSIADRLEDGRPLSTEEILRVGESISQALSYLHRHGVVHRSVKPSNILHARAHGTFKLAGFSSATGLSGQRFGDTSVLDYHEGLQYLSPEQLREQPDVDARSDVYSLGATLYACAAGVPPFSGDTLPQLGTAILRDAVSPLPEEVPEVLRDLIERCLEKDPDSRYPDGAALVAELRMCRAGLEDLDEMDASSGLV